MSDTFEAVRDAILRGTIQVSRHAVRELEADFLPFDSVLAVIPNGELVEDYPDAVRGPCCLICAALGQEEWVHTVWGWDRASGVAVLITAYRPDPRKWEPDFKPEDAEYDNAPDPMLPL